MDLACYHDVVPQMVAVAVIEQNPDVTVIDDRVVCDDIPTTGDQDADNVVMDNIVDDSRVGYSWPEVKPTGSVVTNDITSNDKAIAINVDSVVKVGVLAVEFYKVILDDSAIITM